jgi:hypothetical protein
MACIIIGYAVIDALIVYASTDPSDHNKAVLTSMRLVLVAYGLLLVLAMVFGGIFLSATVTHPENFIIPLSIINTVIVSMGVLLARVCVRCKVVNWGTDINVECMSNSIKTDLNDGIVPFCAGFSICVAGWLIVTNIAAIVSIINTPIAIFVECVILIVGVDLLCLGLSVSKDNPSDPDNTPTHMLCALGGYGLLYGMVAAYCWSVMHSIFTSPENFIIPFSIINTVIVIAGMIALRVYKRCDPTYNGQIAGEAA